MNLLSTLIAMAGMGLSSGARADLPADAAREALAEKADLPARPPVLPRLSIGRDDPEPAGAADADPDRAANREVQKAASRAATAQAAAAARAAARAEADERSAAEKARDRKVKRDRRQPHP